MPEAIGSPPAAGRAQTRRLLQDAGIRPSMGRVVVIEALWRVAGEHGQVSSRRVFEAVDAAGEPLSLVSVRQVLRRLESSGLVVRDGTDRYRAGPLVNDDHFHSRQHG